MPSLEISILKTLAYFNVFSYPLTVEEILFFLDCKVNEQGLRESVEHLVQTGQLWQFENFYTIVNDPSLVHQRVNGNKLAVKFIRRARWVAKFLSWFPFVSGIAISGSLSKHHANKDADLDFFIIAKLNRLWILRMLFAVLFKLAYVSGMKKWFCINYIIDEGGLLIEEKNIFTAVEIATLLPLKGKIVFDNFFKANEWVYEYLPNHLPDYIYLKEAGYNPLKKTFEWIFNSAHANELDDRLLIFFKQRFASFFAKQIVVEKGYIIGSYIATKHSYKPMPQYFQLKVLLKFQEQFAVVEKRYLACAGKEKLYEQVLADKYYGLRKEII